MLCSLSTLAAPATMRIDYYHTGTAKEEVFSLDRIVIEPLPWAGNLSKSIDNTNLGKYFFEGAIRTPGRSFTHEGSLPFTVSGKRLTRLKR